MDDEYTVNEDETLTVAASGVLANDSDPDGDLLLAMLVSDVLCGTLSLNSDGSLQYVPDQDFNGTDFFTYIANDGLADSDEATVIITVIPDNDPPVALDDEYTVDEDETLIVSAPGVLANDTDPDDNLLLAILFSDVSDGTLAFNNDGLFEYGPDPDFYGSDSFIYTASDGRADSNVATVTITVIRVSGPQVIAMTPEGIINQTVDAIDLTFDSDINENTFTTAIQGT